MSTSTEHEQVSQSTLEARILREGYGPGAWHGPNLKAALADVTAAVALWRPASGRHNIAEIALHHAYVLRSVRAQLAAAPPEPFVAAGEDWFEVDDEQRLSWATIGTTLEWQQERLRTTLDDVETRRTTSALPPGERFALVLGVTCHAVYHAGQIQLIKRLHQG